MSAHAAGAEDVRSDAIVRHNAGTYIYLSDSTEPVPRRGVFMKGGCDLASMFVATPLIEKEVSGTLAMYAEGIGISDSHPSVLLQSRQELPEEVLDEVLMPPGADRVEFDEELWQWGRVLKQDDDATRMKLPCEYFRPVLFEPSFSLPYHPELGDFPKTVVALSIGPSLVRSVYRHRQHDYLVDPGGFWLNESMEKFLRDPAAAKWFGRTFQKVGWLTVEEFYEQFSQVIRLVKNETGAHVLVFNTLVVAPFDRTHNYQFVKNNQVLRRREFDLALRDLSHELDFFVLDVDRAVKMSDTNKPLSFAQFPLQYMKPVAEEAFRILKELEVV
jgi:hypothetical protein